MSTVLEIRPPVTEPAPARAERRDQDIRPVRTHQALAVVCALVCFAPLGVAAVVQAGQVRTRLALGDVDGARRASRRALSLCIASALTSVSFVAVIALLADGYSRVH